MKRNLGNQDWKYQNLDIKKGVIRLTNENEETDSVTYQVDLRCRFSQEKLFIEGTSFRRFKRGNECPILNIKSRD